MSESLINATGVGPTATLRGRLVQLEQLKREDFAAASQHLRSIIPDPMEGLAAKIKDLPVEVQKAVAMEAYRDSKAIGELRDPRTIAYFMKADGWAFMVWRAARNTAQDVTYEDCLEYVRSRPDAEIEKLLKQLTGGVGLDIEGLEKNSQGQPRQAATSRLTGNGSSGASHRSTHGRRHKRSRV